MEAVDSHRRGQRPFSSPTKKGQERSAKGPAHKDRKPFAFPTNTGPNGRPPLSLPQEEERSVRAVIHLMWLHFLSR